MFCWNYIIKIHSRELEVDLILHDIYEDIIMGMDSLVTYHANVDCHEKIVTINIPNDKPFKFKRIKEPQIHCLISSIQANWLLEKGYEGYLAYMVEEKNSELDL